MLKLTRPLNPSDTIDVAINELKLDGFEPVEIVDASGSTVGYVVPETFLVTFNEMEEELESIPDI